ncbi:MAG TPA: tyrosinase family protein [Pyrinomonadaceae bacterium]|nr:tyrosinase family protein [Pyrinomonadaceae bacterium]
MKNSRTSRRKFVKSVGLAGGLLLLQPSAYAQAVQVFGRACAKFTRKNINSLTATQLTALKNGVAVMKGRLPSNPTSWVYQANMHGTFDTPAQPAWSTCQHFTLFFLSWHRMYLYFFERILRAASGSATFALPYWNYFDAASRQIPAAYRVPNDATNPLYESNRDSTMNSGGSLPASAVSHTSAFAYVPFNSFSSSLEGTPHGDVHVTVGGGMGSFEFAARDPVFWLHHCNIDRLWNRWIARGGGRTNPVGDPNWMNTQFTFFDETGTQVQMSGSQVLQTAAQLKYCYDEERNWIEDRTERKAFVARQWLRDVLVASEKLELTAKTARIVLNLDDKAKSEISGAVARSADDDAAPQLFLDFEGAEGQPPEGYYEVYINLPENIQDPEYQSPFYAGNLSFFGLGSPQAGHRHEKPRFRLPVTNFLRRESARGILRGNKLTLTLVGRGPISPEGRQLPLSPDSRVQLERVTLSIERPSR